MPVAAVKAEGDAQLANLKKLAAAYGVVIIAPLVTVRRGVLYKSVFRVTPTRSFRADQRVLMDYDHWNEAGLFGGFGGAGGGVIAGRAAGAGAGRTTPFVFNCDGFKIAVLSGFELHFDGLWQELIDQKIDAALVPCANTFESFARWQTLIKSRSFTGGCYILRVNLAGEYAGGGEKWVFYGNSLACNPFGEIENALPVDEREGILIAAISRSSVLEARTSFGFGRIWQKRI